MGEHDGRYKFAFAVTGTRGDFQPYLCLGQELIRRGHQVRYYTSVDHEKTASQFGLTVVKTNGSVEDNLKGEHAKNAMEKGDFLLIAGPPKAEGEEEPEPDLIDGMTVEELREKAGADIQEYKPDLYVTNGLGDTAEIAKVCENFQCMKVEIGLQPQVGPPTNQHNHIAWARQMPEPDTPPICTHIWLHQNAARQNHAAMQQHYYSGIWGEEIKVFVEGPETIFRKNFELEKCHDTHILAYSPSVFPSPPDWPAQSKVQVVGRCCFTPEQQDELSKKGTAFFTAGDAHERCKAFLAAGTPPVYVGWGSMNVYTSRHMTFLAVEALKKAGQRGIILGGWAGLSADDLLGDEVPKKKGWKWQFTAEESRAYAQENVLFLSAAPHEWLFPQCSCCVHHGGIGTMQASLGAGTPTIITPVFADQESNAAALERGGWGKGTTKLGRLQSKELGEAILTVCTDQSYREKTRKLRDAMAKETGIQTAADILERLVKEEALTGKWKENKLAELRELSVLKDKVVQQPVETVLAKWNGELNKRFPAWQEFKRRETGYTAKFASLIDGKRLWFVSASSGVLVREGQKLESPEVGRLKANCFVEEVEKKGSRLHFKKIKGFGPDEGWVTPVANGKDIMENIPDMGRVAAIQGEIYMKLFSDILPQQSG